MSDENKLIFELVTPIKVAARYKVDQVVIPGALGQFGVLPGHDPFMTLLGTGQLVTYRDGEEHYYFIDRGFCEVEEGKVVVLAEVCEASDEIDVERAIAAKNRAESRIRNAVVDADIDFARAEAALLRSLSRIEIASKVQQH